MGWLFAMGLGIWVAGIATAQAKDRESNLNQSTKGGGAAPELELIRELEAADARRVHAFTAPSREELEALLSKDLRYAHSNGVVDSRDSLLEELLSAKTRYLALNYEKREFTFPAPGIALMVGRVRVQAQRGESHLEAPLAYLGVWRLEGGSWRFLAWQSCRLP